ncbi:MAG: CAP domain-containing protein [Carbonactinosporaceae bacterium]
MTPTRHGACGPGRRRSPRAAVGTAAPAGTTLLVASLLAALAAGLGTVVFTAGQAGPGYGTADTSHRALPASASPDAGGRSQPAPSAAGRLHSSRPVPTSLPGPPAGSPAASGSRPLPRGGPAVSDRAGEASGTGPKISDPVGGDRAAAPGAGPPPVGPTASAPPAGRPAHKLERHLVELTSATRARRGCPPLRLDRRLLAAARDHSRDMAERGSLGHESSAGKKPWERSWQHGYFYYWSENLARGQRTAREVLDVWMSDARSRANLLDCGVDTFGVGVAVREGVPWWTVMFGFR